MTSARRKVIGWVLIVLGIMVFAFCRQIVFPGLERLLGIETIVGRQNVIYEPDGGYIFTNPGAMARWIAGVGLVGSAIFLSGVFLIFGASRHRSR